jgi:hypothetical protein
MGQRSARGPLRGHGGLLSGPKSPQVEEVARAQSLREQEKRKGRKALGARKGTQRRRDCNLLAAENPPGERGE